MNDNSKYHQWLSVDQSLPGRIKKVSEDFESIFSHKPTVLTIAPGRAEILGNHTDYNAGQTLSVNICNNLVIVGSPRSDTQVHLLSLNQTEDAEVFDINNFSKSVNLIWKNYVKGVIKEFHKKLGKFEFGFNAIVESTIPMGGGVSSSAALELAFVHFIESLINKPLSPIDRILMAKSAENKYVGSPCGFLDQGTIELSDSSWLMIDYNKDKETNAPITYSQIENGLDGIMLVIGYDAATKRQLTEGKYAARRAVCESVVKLWNEVTKSKIKASCQVSGEEFKSVWPKLKEELILKIKKGLYRDLITTMGVSDTPENIAQMMLEWASHPIVDNDRVKQAIKAITDKKPEVIGELFNESGKGGIYDFDLAEGVGELAWVYETVISNRSEWGVYGIRNMGGGFNATTLSLVKSDMLAHFKSELAQRYKEKFNSEYSFIDFVPAPNVTVVSL